MTTSFHEKPMQDLQVFQSNAYERFTLLHGNRKVNPLHVKRLKQSFSKQYLISPIMVNENYQIIDGQHRFSAAREMGLTINYFIISGYGLPEIQMLNTNTSNWTSKDYLKAFCDMRVSDYLEVQKFSEMYPEFSIESVTNMLSQKSRGGTTNFDGMKGLTKTFQEGNFRCKDIEKGYEMAEFVLEFKEFYGNYNRVSFVNALLSIFKNPKYQHDRMLTKLRNPMNQKISDCVNISVYKELLQQIYNFREPTERKIFF
jgi:hypothetical protein